MARGWINQWTVNLDKWYPKMCASCPFWLDDCERDEMGRKGYCSKLNGRTCRTDWCHLPEEVEKHKEAMANYTVIDYKGERKPCRQAT